VVEALSGALTRTMARPEIRARMLATNIEPLPATPVEFKAFIGRQLAIWKQKVQEAGVEPE
jgi:tripartite-type tricarboxylate transporter receptor subunit TctC